MITADGKLHVKRYMAGYVPAIAQSIAFGIGTTAEASTDTKLQFEVSRSDIVLTAYDFTTDRLVFKAAVPEEFGGVINEVALYSVASNASAGEYGSQLITTFDSDTEQWIDATTLSDPAYTTTARIGADSLNHTPAASTTQTSSLSDVSLDLGGYSGNDRFVLAFNVNNANTSGIKFRFLTDATNYYDISLGAQTAGYKVVEVAKSAAVATGAPDWSSITQLAVLTTSKSTGASDIDYDAIRIEDMDTINPNYVMVNRKVLGTPFVKSEGVVQEIEVSLSISI